MATRWARRICFFNAIGVLLLPVALTLIMATRYFGAPLFVFAATLLWMVVISMVAAVVLAQHGDSLPRRPP